MKPHVSRITALFLLCQIFLIMTHVPLVRVLAWILFCGDHDVFTERGAAKISLYSKGQVGYNVKIVQQSCWVDITARIFASPVLSDELLQLCSLESIFSVDCTFVVICNAIRR